MILYDIFFLLLMSFTRNLVLLILWYCYVYLSKISEVLHKIKVLLFSEMPPLNNNISEELNNDDLSQ